jgi:Putative phage tail protein
MKRVIRHSGKDVPIISGAGGGSKGSGQIAPNSLFSTDILYVTTAIGEGPIYRINPNGPQDIQIQDGAIDDLINLDSNGLENTDKFLTVSTTGTVTQDPLPKFGDEIVSPQIFASQVSLKKGNLQGVPSSSITLQQTSASDWDAIRFTFVIEELYSADTKGNVSPNSVTYRIRIYDSIGTTLLVTSEKTVSEKTDTPYKFSETVRIPPASRSANGYRFSIDKTSDDSDNPRLKDTIKVLSWDELKYTPQAYPRTALIGYALKAMNEYTGGVPNFTSVIKGLLVKVPSNYNQPILSNGDIDWREIEVGQTLYTTYGYRLQRPGTGTVLYDQNPEIYTGTWDGTFIYSWTQNPVWIVYDILTNKSYGLGIPEENIDKYKFYQVAQYCDACDFNSGRFIGVSAVADGSFRYKPRTLFSSVRENQLGLAKGTKVSERRFITDVTISDQEKAMDVLNKITATFRSMLVYSGGKISLAVDMPDEYPVMLFNETNIKQGTFQIAGVKESEVYTGVDITYVEPTNHFKREVVRLDLAEANDGRDVQTIENIASLDLTGVTRRSQAIRLGQYQLAAARYLRRNITFTTSTEALSLSPGDVISVAMNGTGIAYGYGGRVKANSLVGSSNTNVTLEHYTVPSLSNSVFTANTYPLALRIIRNDSDKMDLYIVSNTIFSVTNTGETSTGADQAVVRVTHRFDPLTRQLTTMPSGFSVNIAPRVNDLWTLGEFENPGNYYTNKSGKLFKVTGVKRDGNESEVIVSGIEYISNVYTDSDTFINYEPTAYTDITSPFATPPAPVFTFTAVPRTKLDGTVVFDGVLNNRTESIGYGQKYETDYFVARPDAQLPIANVISNSPLRFSTFDTAGLANNILSCTISGKNGFTTPAGDIRLLCNAVSVPSPGQLALTLEGLRLCVDENFNQHVLAVNDGGAVPNLRGIDQINIPIREKANVQSLVNFVGYQSDVTSITREILSYNTTTDTVVIADTTSGAATLSSAMLNPPFYVNINQILAKNYYANNSVYVRGTEIAQVLEGQINTSVTVNTIELPNKPRTASDVALYIDGIRKTAGLYTVNLNTTSPLKANVAYSRQPSDTTYRVEVAYYTVPTIEVGDRLEVNYGNVFTVVNTSYSTSSARYNAALTSNSVFRIQLDTAPDLDLSGYSFINVTQNPIGTTTNVQSNVFTLSYDANTYPGIFSLANSGVYTLELASNYEKVFLTTDSRIPELPLGITSVRARNRNVLGRTSPYVTQSVVVEQLPIQRVENLTLQESLYREQTGGVAVRVTCSFDHIVGQEVTDYEISYKLAVVDSAGIDDAGTPLTFFNTVKVPASGVESDGKIRFTVNNINRGTIAESNSITVKVTPLNKNIRGVTATASIPIKGKTVAPQNVFGFTGGQQNEVITFFWNYPRVEGDLADLDLKEVIVSRLPGEQPITLENFLGAVPLVTVSVPSARKSIPIDSYGTYTYLVRTRDTSGNLSTDVVGTVITTTRAQRSSIVAAYSEDNPAVPFEEGLTNANSTEFYFPSFANSTNGGLSGPSTSRVDNANGYSSGWSVVSGAPTNLLAAENATYITQIRDFGQTITGQINIDIEASQEVQTAYTDQHERVLSGVTDVSSSANVLIDTSFGGIGRVLGFANASVTTGRYDANNRTWMTGPANGNVWAIWNHGQFTGDTANLNSYALIAGLINANAIALGESYFANGVPTGGNTLSNVTSGNDAYTLVNLVQYNDTGSSTYAGTLGVVSAQTFIRTTTSNVYYANGNVNAQVFSSSGDGWIPYEVGNKSFRYFQIKYQVENARPDEFDYTVDHFRYTVSKEQTIFTDTVVYDTSPKTIDLSSAKFIYTPVVNFTVVNQIDAEANPAIVVTTATSNQSISFKLFASDGTGAYAANSTANIMITAIGV